MTPSAAPTPLDVLRDHQCRATPETTGSEGTAYCAWCEAVADVETLVEAARGITFAVWEGSDEECEAAQRFRAALAPFAGDGNERAT